MTTEELVLSNGEKVKGEVTVVNSSRVLFQALADAKIESSKKEILTGLFDEIARLACTMPDLEGIQLVRTANSMCNEISSETPRPMWLNLSLEGLTNMAGKLGNHGNKVISILQQIKSWYGIA